MDFPLIQLYVKCGCKHNYFLILIIEHLDWITTWSNSNPKFAFQLLS
jgi:hypothetical protein